MSKGKYNILYVDDDKANLHALKLLHGRKFNVLTALSGKEGIQLLGTNSIYVVITYQRTSNITSFDFLKKAKKKYPKIKYILLSDLHDSIVIKEAINNIGIFWYLIKPFNNEELEGIITRALEAYFIENEKEKIYKKFQLILDTAYDAIITINNHQIIEVANPAALKMFGYKQEEIIGENLSILIPTNVKNHGELLNKFGHSKPESRQMSSGNIIYGKTKSGSLVALETNLSKINLDGKVYFNAIIRDVSVRKKAEDQLLKSEKKFKDIFNSMIDVFIRRDMNGKGLIVSPSITDVTGYSQSEINNQDLANYFVDPIKMEEVYESLNNNGGIQSFESEIYKKDGSIITISSNSKLFYDLEGKPLGVESVFRDITKEKRIKLEIENYQKKLKNLTNELTISHEQMHKKIAVELHDQVGQLLTSSRMQLASIDYSESPDKIKDKINSVSKDLLTAAKSTRELIFSLSPPQLNQIGLFAAIHDWMKEQVEQKHHIKTFITGSSNKYNLEENIRFLLFRCAKELIVNCVKHANSKHIEVRINSINKILVLEVNDDGIGFIYKAQNGIHNTNGYGLFSIQEQIINLGGTMNIESEIGLGTTVTLKIAIK